jgi:hypothetical protein
LRREVLLRNEKSDSVTRSVVTSSKPFPSASPTLIAGPASTSRGFSNRTSRGTFPPLFSNVYSLLDGLSPSLLAASFRRTFQMFFAFSSALPTLPAGSACKLSPLLARAKISSLSSPSVRLPPAEPANSPSTFGSREFLSSVLLLR